MKFTVLINGVAVDCHDTDAVFALVNDPRATRARGGGRTRVQEVVSESMPTYGPAAGESAVGGAHAFLAAIKSSFDGLSAEEAVRLLGAKNVAGVGGKLKIVNQQLVKLGVVKGEAYESRAGVFRAGDRLDEALARLRAKEPQRETTANGKA